MSQAALPAVLCDSPSTAPVAEKWRGQAGSKAGAAMGWLPLGRLVGRWPPHTVWDRRPLHMFMVSSPVLWKALGGEIDATQGMRGRGGRQGGERQAELAGLPLGGSAGRSDPPSAG